LKTFFSGWAANAAISEGLIDFIPCHFKRIPTLIRDELVTVNAAIIQITPPDETGFCSFGAAVDGAREAMAKASVAIGEINPSMPFTFGDTLIQLSDFDYLVQAQDPPIYFERWFVDPVLDRIAQQVAAHIEDGSCLAFSIGPFFEALAKNLVGKRHLGVHSPFFTDALMDLMRSGAVSNQKKETHCGRSLSSYAVGTKDLFQWLDRNPLVEFQRIDTVSDPLRIGRNPRVVAVLLASRADLYGRISLEVGDESLAFGPAQIIDFYNAADISDGGRTLFALPSRDHSGKSNILVSIAHETDQFSLIESVRTVITEYGAAFLEGHTIRERAQLLIEIAHPDDRSALVEQAKANHILYQDQIYLAESARLYPAEIDITHTFRGVGKVKLRPIKPSDEEGMRRLFYRFSSEAVYYRYFHSVRSMPHSKMQAYVNVDWTKVMSLVVLKGLEEDSGIIAEARYIKIENTTTAEVVFVVDENHQKSGIATYLYQLLVKIARERGLSEFVADVLFSNTAMMKVFRKGTLPVHACLNDGVYHISIPLR
jgi:acyl-CoA hydrolase/GNAT superfamily N-acetyltransferase